MPVGTLLIFSTMYCRYHYLVDVIAGLILAFATVPLAERWYDHVAEEEVAAPETI